MSPLFRSNALHLQLIVGEEVADPVGLVTAAAWGGVDSIQIRMKESGAEELLQQSRTLIAALDDVPRRPYILVNDRLDVALLAGADGVHLPEASFGPQQAVAIQGLAAEAPSRPENAPFLVGRSIHAPQSAQLEGSAHLHYVLFGHVFPSSSKPNIAPGGLEALAHTVAQSPVPVLAIGGITAENAGAAIEAGAAGVAVISAITLAPDPYEATLALRRALADTVNRINSEKEATP